MENLQAEELQEEELEQVSGGVSIVEAIYDTSGCLIIIFYYSSSDTKDQIMGKVNYGFSARSVVLSTAQKSEISSYIREGHGGVLKVTIGPDGSLSVVSY